MSASRILVVVTSHGLIADRPRTGIWFTEFSEPFAVLTDAGFELTVASPRGCAAPIDPRSYPTVAEATSAHEAMRALNATLPLAAVDASAYVGIFLPGGHGPMFDLADDATLKALLASFHRSRKPIGAVCHGPAGLLDVRLDDGTTLLAGRRVTAFTHGEDALDELFADMPFSLEARMMEEGARFVEQPPKAEHVETDGLLVTGQNPNSARATARAFADVVAGSRVA